MSDQSEEKKPVDKHLTEGVKPCDCCRGVASKCHGCGDDSMEAGIKRCCFRWWCAECYAAHMIVDCELEDMKDADSDG